MDTEQLLHLPSFLRDKPGAIQRRRDDAENTRLHQSGSYLATDEDERPCDDRPVFDKCVFHLVGERSTEGKKSARGNRGGEERASEGRCEANAVNDSTREAGKDTGGRERGRERKSARLRESKESQRIKDLAKRPLTLPGLCFVRAIQGEYIFRLMWLL